MVEQQNGNEIETLEEFKVDRVLDAHDYFLEYLFPDAILYGMSYEEFWNKDPQLFYSYRFAYIEKIDIERNRSNYEAWLEGLYNFRAFNTVLYNAFKRKEERPQSYLTKPIDFNEKPETKEVKENKEIKKRNNWARLKERSVK